MSWWKKLVEKFIPQQGEPVDWEALLIEADFGMALASRWTSEIDKRGWNRDPVKASAWLREEVVRLMTAPPMLPAKTRPEVILFAGVNGSGKTTTIAKMAGRAQRSGQRVRLAAGDTFRAAAVEQLQRWAERLQVPIVTASPGSDPASVGFRAVEEAIQASDDLVLVDTAGRMPNKNNLMLEIGKVKRVLAKALPSAPHQILLVVDGTTGLNVLQQAKEFHQALQISGLVITKLDGTAKGGMAVAVRVETGIPTLWVGRGEAVHDLIPFEAQAYATELFARD